MNEERVDPRSAHWPAHPVQTGRPRPARRAPERSRRRSRLRPLFALALLVGACSNGSATLREPADLTSLRECRITRVIDGDTVVCDGDERVRLLLIDTPERTQAPYGGLATRALEELIAGDPRVRLEQDIEPRDQYGRTLAYVWLSDGRMLNEEMARSGYAVVLVYPPNVRYVDRIRIAVEEARQARRGLWRTEAFECAPVDHRRGRC